MVHSTGSSLEFTLMLLGSCRVKVKIGCKGNTIQVQSDFTRSESEVNIGAVVMFGGEYVCMKRGSIREVPHPNSDTIVDGAVEVAFVQPARTKHTDPAPSSSSTASTPFGRRQGSGVLQNTNKFIYRSISLSSIPPRRSR